MPSWRIFPRFAALLAVAACAMFCAPRAHAQGGIEGYSTTTVSLSGNNATGYIAGASFTVTMTVQNTCDPDEYDGDLYTTIGNLGNEDNPAYSSPPNYFGPGTWSAEAIYTGYNGTDLGGEDCTITGSDAFVNFTVPGPVGSVTTATGPTTSVIAGTPITLQVFAAPPSQYQEFTPATGTASAYYGEDELATATVTNGTATIVIQTTGLPTGTYPLTVAYSGDANYIPSTSSPVSVMIAAKQTSSTTFTVTPNPLVVGDTVTFQATVVPSPTTYVPGGTVTFALGTSSLGTATLSTTSPYTATLTLPTAGLPAGNYAITASYNGDIHDLASQSQGVTVELQAQSPTTTTMAITPTTTVAAGAALTFKATVAQSVGNTVPTGDVSLMLGPNVIGTLPLASGTATAYINTTGVAPGVYSVYMQYAGDATDKSSASASQNVTILHATSVTGSASPNPVAVGSTTFLTAKVAQTLGTAAPTGTVTFSYEGFAIGSAQLGTNGQATLPLDTGALPDGTYTLTASYSGDVNNSASASTFAVTITN